MKKFLSLVLALTLVASLFTINVMATGHTVTISVDKTTELKAGDTVTVEVILDSTAGLEGLDYALAYDVDAFEVDMVEEAYQDADWYTEITAIGGTKNKKFADYLGFPTYTPAWDYDNGVLLGAGKAGEIAYAWAGSTAIADAKNEDDKVIGKFYLKVKADVVDGDYVFSLTGSANSVALISTPVTVTVGSGAPTPATPSISEAAPTATGAGIAANREGVEFIYDNAYAVTVKMTNANKATKAGIQFIPAAVLATNGNSWDDASEAVFTTGLGDGEVGYTAALINIPRKFAGQDITMKARGFMVVDGATIVGTEVDSVVNYTVTAEPGQN